MTIASMLLIFCSINQHGKVDSACYQYISDCIDNRRFVDSELSVYPQCTTQWILNANKVLGRCFNPDLKVNQPENDND